VTDNGDPELTNEEEITVTVNDSVCGTTVVNTNDSGPGSFRAAIICANAMFGVQTIEFAIPGAGPHTIQPLSALPTITDAVILDATTQPGYTLLPLIELDGSLAGAGASGLWLRGGNSTVKGFAINRFSDSGITISGEGGNTIEYNLIGTDVTGAVDQGNLNSGVVIAQKPDNVVRWNVISGNNKHGVYIVGAAAVGNLVEENLIGLDITGSAALGNGIYGVYLGAPNNTIHNNAISANAVAGVYIVAAGGNQLQYNLIGLNQAGDAAVGSQNYGVDVRSGGNTIGGSLGANTNVISGNVSGGVLLLGAAATGNVVSGNLIGTDIDGLADVGNLGAGVVISGASGNLIADNVISGNDLQGVYVTGTNNTIQGNTIGVDAAGTAALPNSNYGVYLAGASNRVGGTAEGQGNTISGNSRGGVLINGVGATSNVVEGNRIGSNAAGDAALGNASYGVDVRTANNTIGGDTLAAGNVISGNLGGGVQLVAAGAQGNVVQGNRIGTNLAGISALANAGVGVTVASAANNTIRGNLISGNTLQGVLISGNGATGNVITANAVGTNAAGTAALANGNVGVYLGSGGNRVGGTAPSDGNLISGNTGSGIYIINAAGPGNTVQGNLIGTNMAGTAALGNGRYGIDVRGIGNTIGGTVAGSGNVISGNPSGGVQITGTGATGNVIQGNKIGTYISGTLIVGNNGPGVSVSNAANNTIGGTVAGAGNVITGNRRGILIAGATATGNAIQQNSIYQNIALGIDLNPDGVTPNDVGDSDGGPNLQQNFPAMTLAVLSGGTLTIGFTVPSIAPNSIFPLSVEFFLADVDNQEGWTYLGTHSYAAPGADSAVLPAGGALVGQRIVATATDVAGNTSEFSASVMISAALQAPAGGEGESDFSPLSMAQLEPVISQAGAWWQAAGLDAARVASLSISIADLPGRYLGLATQNWIVLDIDAAGYGWYIDPAPQGSGADVPEGRMDLLTAVLHEMGHVFGLDDSDDEHGLMAGVLQPGTRQLPSLADIDEVLAGEDWLA